LKTSEIQKMLEKKIPTEEIVMSIETRASRRPRASEMRLSCANSARRMI